jgi:hypothetical protein
MKILTPFLLAAALFCGCASFPQHMRGTFTARNSDFITIEKDGSFYWSPMAKTPTNKRSLVGTARPDEDDPTLLRLGVHSASPFLYSSARFSSNYSHLTVDWGRIAGEAGANRATEYERTERE